MKIVRFTAAGYESGAYGVFNSDGKIDVVKGGLFDGLDKTGATIEESAITRYLPPVDPLNILAIGLNYVDHAAETSQELPKQPLLFMKATSSVIGHGDVIRIPRIAPTNVDFEAELGVIIGKSAKHVSEEDALNYVFGYTCAHDVSARDVQKGDGQWVRGKSFDTFAPIGPYVVTDIDPSDVRVQLRLNGETMQDQSTRDMVFNVRFLVSYLSRSMTLNPGTVIFSGTPCGVGMARNPQVFLKPGDVTEVDIAGIGVLRNTLEAE